MKKIVVFVAAFMLLLTACSKEEDKTVSKTSENPGNIYLKQDDGTYSSIALPEIISGNEIFESARISESIIVIRTQQKFYVIDYKNGIYETIEPNGILQQDKIITTKKDELNVFSDFTAK